MQENQKMVLGAHDKPSTGKWIVLSIQHVFAMFGATILVPMLTGLPISVALFTSGVGTLIYILCTKAKVPVYLGSSFAFIAPIQYIISYDGSITDPNYYFAPVLTGLFVVGLIYVIVSLLVKYIGTDWIDKLLPPIIIGPMIAIIGFGLAGTAVENAGLVEGGDWRIILTALASFLIVIIVAIKAKGFLKVIPFLCGIVGGYLVAVILGIVDFSAVKEVASAPAEWFKIPEFMFLGLKDKEVVFLGSNITFYQLEFSAVLGLAPLAFVTICEHIGDHAVLSEITGDDYLHDPGLNSTLLGDGLATMFAAMVGGPANTTYGENTTVVGMTKIASVWVTGLAAVVAILLSFSNLFVTIVGTIPTAVMGGISIILYGFIGMNGVKIMIENQIDYNKTRNMIVSSTMLVLGLGGAVVGKGAFVMYGMALAAVVGIILNLILPEE